MKKLSLIISLLYGSALINGCSSVSPEQKNWTIKPYQAIHHATNRADGYYSLGRFHQGQNRLDLAAEAYRKAVAIDPDFFEAHNGLGTIYALQGKYEQARIEFNAAVAMAPDSAHTYNNLGYSYYLQGNYAEAVANFNKATALDPANQKSRINLSMALAKNGETLKASLVAAPANGGTTAVEVHSDKESNRAVSNESGPHTTAATSALSEDNGGRVDTQTANKPMSDSADRATPINANEAKAVHIAKVTPQPIEPPFAVLTAPNTKAMVVVMSSNPRPATEKVTRVQPPRPMANPVDVSNRIVAISTSNGLPAKNTPSESQLVLNWNKVSDSKTAFIDAPSLQGVHSDSKSGERNYALEVSNGNGIEKLAYKIGSILSNEGLPKASLSNQKPYNQSHTVIHYRKGYLFEAARLRRYLQPIQSLTQVVESKELGPHTDVKLILGKDLSDKLEWINKSSSIKLASR